MADSGSDPGDGEKVLLLKAKRTFVLRHVAPTTGSRLSITERVLSVYESSDVLDPDSESTDLTLGHSTKEVLRFYIDTDALFHLPIWPFNGSQKLSIFDISSEEKKEPSVGDVVKRLAEPAQSLLQSHGLFDRHMCTRGSIHAPMLITISTLSNSKLDISIPSQSPDMKVGRVSSGLGHGVWGDETLAEILGPVIKGNKQRANDEEVNWIAKGNSGPWEAFADTRNARKIVVDGLGWTEAGGLVLEGKERVYAVYKPRVASWKTDEGGEDTEANGKKYGVLAIFREGLDMDVVKHLLLSAVTIEEQIMRSAGFDSTKYHGGW